jgi:hypothetical protein
MAAHGNVAGRVKTGDSPWAGARADSHPASVEEPAATEHHHYEKDDE